MNIRRLVKAIVPKRKTLLKTVVYKLVAVGISLVIAFIVTRSLVQMGCISVTTEVVQGFFYFYYDRWWLKRNAT